MKLTNEVLPPQPQAMDLKEETKPLVQKEVKKCTWSFFKGACCGAFKETCNETFREPRTRTRVFLEQHKNFLPHLG